MSPTCAATGRSASPSSDPLALEFFLQRSAEDDRKADEPLVRPAVSRSRPKARRKPASPRCPVNASNDENRAALQTTNLNAAVTGTRLPTSHQHVGLPTASSSSNVTAAAATASSFLASIGGAKSAPMPPPQSPGASSSSSSHRSPSSSGNVGVANYPQLAQSPVLYPVRSPASSPLPSSSAAAAGTVPTTAFVQVARAPNTMTPTSMNIVQQQHRTTSHSPFTIPVSSASTVLSGAIPVGGQIMQFIQAPAQHQYRTHPAKPKQPQQILPKPASGMITSVQQSYGGVKSSNSSRGGGGSGSSSGGQAAAAAAVNAAAAAGSLVLAAGHQGHQTMLTNASNMTVGPQGTFLLNHFSLGVGQNQILIPAGGHGLPHNLQLVVRPNVPSNNNNSGVQQQQQQNNASQTGAPTMNSALIAALQAQAAAAQSSFQAAAAAAKNVTPNTALGHGQTTMVIPTGGGQNHPSQHQVGGGGGVGGGAGGAHQMIRPNMTRVVSQMSQMSQPQAAPLVLQQIQTPQGPITVAISATQLQALQSCGLGVSGPSLTLSNPSPSNAGGSATGQGFVLNNHSSAAAITTTTNSPAATTVQVGGYVDPSMTQVTQLHQQQQQQQQLCVAPMQLQLQQQQQQQQPEMHSEPDQQPQQQPKVHSVNLEELLKQAGIMPEDSSPSPPPPQTPPPPSAADASAAAAAAVQPQMEQYQSVVTFAPMVQNDQQQQQQQQVVDAQSQLIAQLQQQPMMTASHLQTSQGQLKVALGQDGNFYIQRPVFPTVSSSGGGGGGGGGGGSQMTIAHHPQVSFPMASVGLSCSATSTSANSSPVTVMSTSATQPIHSVLLHGLQAAAAAAAQQQVDHQQMMNASDPSGGMLHPFTVQGINAIGLMSAGSIQAAVSAATTGTSTSNAILSSMLSHNHPTLMQTLSTNDAAAAAASGRGYSAATLVSNKPTTAAAAAAVIQQNPLLVQSLQTANFSGASDEQQAGSATSFYLSEFSAAPHQQQQQQQPPSVDNLSGSVVAAGTPAAAVQHQQCQIMTGYPITGVQPVQKVQTIQLRPQDQEALQKIQAQLKAIVNRGPATAQQLAIIQHLQSEQQKILAQGKVISVHQQPAVAQLQKQQLLNQLGNQSTFRQQPTVRPPRKKKKRKKPAAAATTTAAAAVQTPQLPTTIPQGCKISAQATQTTATQAVTSTGGVSLANFITQVGPSITAVTAMPVDSIASSAPTSLPATTTTTHVKIGNQIIALTPQQQRQAAHHLQLVKNAPGSEQQQLLLQPGSGKQALIVKLQQPLLTKPIAACTPNSTQSSTASSSSSSSSGALNFPTGILQFQNAGASVSHLKPLPGSSLSEQVNRGVKRTATVVATRANAFHQRVTSDQNAVMKPDCKTPFRSQEDACKRLLRYHVYSSKMWSEEEMQKDDEHFEAVSRQLLDRASQMLNKYRYLLLRESMKETSTAERVMLERVFIQDETACLQQDRIAVKDGKELELPSPPDHWLDKMRLMGPPPSPPDQFLKSLANPIKQAVVNPIKVHLARRSDDETYASVASIIKQEPIDEPVFGETSCSSSSSSSSAAAVASGGSMSMDYSSSGGGIRCKDEVKRLDSTDDKPLPAATSTRHKNYDEWAEIQKELEMYPLEHDDQPTPAAHLEFDAGEDGGSSLVDFEPPIPKAIKEDVDGSYNGQHYHNSYHPDHHHHHHHHHHRIINKIHQAAGLGSAGDCDVAAAAVKWSDAAASADDDEYRTEGHHHHHHHHHQQVVADLLQTTFKSPSSSPLDVDDMLANGGGGGGFDRLQDEDLNAQVESAINSILNLQRLDESGVRDAAFVASVVQQQCQAAAAAAAAAAGMHLQQATTTLFDDGGGGGGGAASIGSDEDDDDEDDDEVNATVAVVNEEQDAKFAFDSQSPPDAAATADDAAGAVVAVDKVEVNAMDYDDDAATTNMDTYAQDDGPSEMDVALDEAVKSILL